MMVKLERKKFHKLSPVDLADIEQRFRERKQARQDAHGGDQRRACSRLFKRVLIWCAALMVLAIIISTIREKRKPPPAQVQQGASIALLRDAARLPADLREFETRAAVLDGLAAGSKTARDAQIDFARTHGFPVEVVNTIAMRFRLIPPGAFIMGSPNTEAGRSPDEPAHSQTMTSPFYLGICEVTQAQWSRVMGADNNPSWYKTKNNGNPVEKITWYDAVNFCEKLCESEGVPEGTYRLPHEREWEYACRAGTQTPYSSAGDWRELRYFADFKENGDQGTSRVGRLRPNAWGLYDMHGNVWEWCGNNFYTYGEPGAADPQYKAIRGGNWHLTALDCRAASRYRLPPDSHGNVCGFRVLRVAPLTD
jgi:formylglycine-generating enzyme required for sulfatase activity